MGLTNIISSFSVVVWQLLLIAAENEISFNFFLVRLNLCSDFIFINKKLFNSPHYTNIHNISTEVIIAKASRIFIKKKINMIGIKYIMTFIFGIPGWVCAVIWLELVIV